MKPERIDHICIAVKDVKKAEEFYSKTFDMEPTLRYVFEPEKINVVRYQIGEVSFEVLEGTSPDSEVSKFIEKNGEGVFLLSFKMANTADAIADMNKKGVPMLDQEPRIWRDSAYAFCNPKAFNGVLVELID